MAILDILIGIFVVFLFLYLLMIFAWIFMEPQDKMFIKKYIQKGDYIGSIRREYARFTYNKTRKTYILLFLFSFSMTFTFLFFVDFIPHQIILSLDFLDSYDATSFILFLIMLNLSLFSLYFLVDDDSNNPTSLPQESKIFAILFPVIVLIVLNVIFTLFYRGIAPSIASSTDGVSWLEFFFYWIVLSLPIFYALGANK